MPSPCERCGAMTVDGAKFCTGCGALIAVRTQASATDQCNCSACSTPNPSLAKFCTSCGCPFDADQISRVNAPLLLAVDLSPSPATPDGQRSIASGYLKVMYLVLFLFAIGIVWWIFSSRFVRVSESIQEITRSSALDIASPSKPSRSLQLPRGDKAATQNSITPSVQDEPTAEPPTHQTPNAPVIGKSDLPRASRKDLSSEFPGIDLNRSELIKEDAPTKVERQRVLKSQQQTKEATQPIVKSELKKKAAITGRSSLRRDRRKGLCVKYQSCPPGDLSYS